MKSRGAPLSVSIFSDVAAKLGLRPANEPRRCIEEELAIREASRATGNSERNVNYETTKLAHISNVLRRIILL